MAKKTVKIVKKSRPVEKVAKTSRKRLPFKTDVPVNVKVAGEKTMRKNVVLVLDPDHNDRVRVLTGRRGRPAVLAVSDIEKVRAL